MRYSEKKKGVLAVVFLRHFFLNVPLRGKKQDCDCTPSLSRTPFPGCSAMY